MATMITVTCCKCGKEYDIELKKYNAKTKEGSNFYCSKECKHHKNSVLCQCATCGKPVWRTQSQLSKSKTGNVYCSKSCAASQNNRLFKIGKNHGGYVDGHSSYRAMALSHYPNVCMCCGWNEDERVLEVHHIDGDRTNNQLSNLSILCPTCHRKITLGYYMLEDDFSLTKIEDVV